MSKSDTWESDLLKLLFTNIAATGIGDAGGLLPSAAAGSLFVSLHTSDPGEASASTETVFTNYARVAVVRSSGGWTVSGTSPTQVANAATVSFPQCGSTGATVTHFGIWTALSGGKMLYSAALTTPLAVSNLVTPQFAAGSLVVSED